MSGKIADWKCIVAAIQVPEACLRAGDGREPTIEPNKQKAIGVAELWSLRYLPAKHVELLAKD
jgi:hypothetical protein